MYCRRMMERREKLKQFSPTIIMGRRALSVNEDMAAEKYQGHQLLSTWFSDYIDRQREHNEWQYYGRRYCNVC